MLEVVLVAMLGASLVSPLFLLRRIFRSKKHIVRVVMGPGHSAGSLPAHARVP